MDEYVQLTRVGAEEGRNFKTTHINYIAPDLTCKSPFNHLSWTFIEEMTAKIPIGQTQQRQLHGCGRKTVSEEVEGNGGYVMRYNS